MPQVTWDLPAPAPAPAPEKSVSMVKRRRSPALGEERFSPSSILHPRLPLVLLGTRVPLSGGGPGEPDQGRSAPSWKSLASTHHHSRPAAGATPARPATQSQLGPFAPPLPGVRPAPFPVSAPPPSRCPPPPPSLCPPCPLHCGPASGWCRGGGWEPGARAGGAVAQWEGSVGKGVGAGGWAGRTLEVDWRSCRPVKPGRGRGAARSAKHGGAGRWLRPWRRRLLRGRGRQQRVQGGCGGVREAEGPKLPLPRGSVYHRAKDNSGTAVQPLKVPLGDPRVDVYPGLALTAGQVQLTERGPNRGEDPRNDEAGP
ncbi:HAUS augmin-like complex subunit 7 isoform X3 [Pan paniscus]|uniref:HAUS augmin-like complex subunit 7 isoform X3 n=1 Tax=Pan paniscus TaxID=9597 RepID=UPI0015614B6C